GQPPKARRKLSKSELRQQAAAAFLAWRSKYPKNTYPPILLGVVWVIFRPSVVFAKDRLPCIFFLHVSAELRRYVRPYSAKPNALVNAGGLFGWANQLVVGASQS